MAVDWVGAAWATDFVEAGCTAFRSPVLRSQSAALARREEAGGICQDYQWTVGTARVAAWGMGLSSS